MRPTGLIHDLLSDIEDDLRRPDRNFGVHSDNIGGSLLASSVDYTKNIDYIRDQQFTQACVGFAMTRAAHIRAQLLGLSMTHPSPAAPYTAALAYDVPEPGQLVDIGCRPRACAMALMDPEMCAMVPESVYPFAAHTVTRRLPMHVYRAADGAKFHYYRIAGDGTARLDAIMRALTLGHPVVFGLATDQAFHDYAGGIYWPEGEDLGAHMMCLVGYSAGCYVAVNSWGKFWGDNGLIRIPPEIMGSAIRTSNVMAIDLVEAA